MLKAETSQLSLSQLTLAQRKALTDFGPTGAVLQQQQGRGSVFQALNRAVIEQHLSDMGPALTPRPDYRNGPLIWRVSVN